MSNIKCGKCKGYHPDVDGVRDCYLGSLSAVKIVDGDVDEETQASRMFDKFVTDTGMKTDDGPMWPASDKQIAYVLGLQEERTLPPNYDPLSEATMRKMEKDVVSASIRMLKEFPRKESSKHESSRALAAIPPGRYALPGADGDWDFLQVDKPTEGRWKGYVFIKRLIGAPGDYRKVNVDPATRGSLLNRIAADPKAAMVAYGRQTSVCGRCSSPLTDKTSREIGIGPVCRTKDGWF